MRNVHDHHRGRSVVTLRSSRTRRLPADFVGWGHPDAIGSLLEPKTGLTGRITNVESHGSNPWTRYTVRFDDGSTASGLVLGVDVEMIAERDEDEPCERGTVGCCIEHVADSECETW